MKNICILILLTVSTGLFSQETDKADVQKTIESFFEGFHKQDSIHIKKVVQEGAILQTIGMNKQGEMAVKNQDFSAFLKSIATIPATMKIEEKIKSYHIQVDGAMANAWTEYEFWINDEMRHCGVNSFQLFKDKDTWKIIYLIDTRRREGCK